MISHQNVTKNPEEVEKKSKPTLDDDYDPVFLPRSYCVRIPHVLFSLQIYNKLINIRCWSFIPFRSMHDISLCA